MTFPEEMRARAEAYAPDNANRVHRTRYSAFHAGAHAALESEMVRGIAEALRGSACWQRLDIGVPCRPNATEKCYRCKMLAAYDEALKAKG